MCFLVVVVDAEACEGEYSDEDDDDSRVDAHQVSPCLFIVCVLSCRG